MAEADIISSKSNQGASRYLAFIGSFGVFVVALLVCVGLAAIKYYQVSQLSSQGPPPEMPTAVELYTAQSVQFRTKSIAVGTVVAPQSIILSNEVPGTVSSARLSPGAIVDPGTVLVELDSSVEKAQLNSALAAAAMAQSRYQRVKEAQQNGALTELELDEAESQLTQAQARVAELTAIIERKRLIAPFKARIGISDTHVGQYLPSGSTITSLQGVDDYLFVDFSLPQHVAESIQIGERVSVQIANQTHWGEVIALDSRVDRTSRNLLVRARLEGLTELVRPGNSLAVEVEYGPDISGILLPSSAVRRTPSGTQVFVAQQSQDGQLRASRRSVQIQSSLGDECIVSSGVVLGDQVVSNGAFKLFDGGLLQVSQ